MTALAATIGTGNIVGVATAVTAGGPGAVFWMWLTGVFGIATKYAESLLSVKYRVVNAAGHMAGGPMYVLERGMNCRWLGVVLATLTAISAFGIGNAVQANSVATLLRETLHISPWISGAVMTALTAAVILGGIQSIARWCAWLVPFMALFYVFGCLVLLCLHAASLPETIKLIVGSAFNGHAAVAVFRGGSSGIDSLRRGARVFSNESGLGSAPIVAAAARPATPSGRRSFRARGTSGTPSWSAR